MQKVINTYLEYKGDGVTTAWVYRNHIYPIYHISISTLYFYLRTPVKKLIKEDTAAKPAHQIAPNDWFEIGVRSEG